MRRTCWILLLLSLLRPGALHGQALEVGTPPAWDRGIPSAPFLWPSHDTVRVCLIGDVMMHMPQLRHDYEAFFRYVAAPMREADIAVANMEFTLAGEPYSGYPNFSAPDRYAWTVCRELGLDVMLTANNHIADKGRPGLERTLGVYDGIRDSLGVLQTGASRSEAEAAAVMPLVVPCGDFRLGFVNFPYGTNVDPLPYAWPRPGRMAREDYRIINILNE